MVLHTVTMLGKLFVPSPPPPLLFCVPDTVSLHLHGSTLLVNTIKCLDTQNLPKTEGKGRRGGGKVTVFAEQSACLLHRHMLIASQKQGKTSLVGEGRGGGGV